jgi:hypothetical protein
MRIIYYIVILVLIVLLLLGYFWIQPQIHSQEEKHAVAMTGRSTMKLWFKHWNWPYPLRIKATYKNWPIAYNKYSRKNLYLEYHALPAPFDNDQDTPFGKDMIDAFQKVLDNKKYETAFFKFCFVDFKVKPDTADERFNNLINTARQAYDATHTRGIKLVFGNALPMPNSNEATIQVQKKFNDWLITFAQSHTDVMIFDMYTPLIDNQGRLRQDLARGDGDAHLNDKAFSLLDETLFDQISNWLGKQ